MFDNQKKKTKQLYWKETGAQWYDSKRKDISSPSTKINLLMQEQEECASHGKRKVSKKGRQVHFQAGQVWLYMTATKESEENQGKEKPGEEPVTRGVWRQEKGVKEAIIIICNCIISLLILRPNRLVFGYHFGNYDCSSGMMMVMLLQ